LTAAERADFERLGDLLPSGGEAAGGRPPEGGGSADGSAEGNRQAAAVCRQVAEVWEDTVGAEIAANARPVQLREGRLVVTTSSSAWSQSLQLMSELVLARLNARLGPGAVKKAVFRHAGWEEFPVAAAAPVPAPTTTTGAGPRRPAAGRRRSRTPSDAQPSAAGDTLSDTSPRFDPAGLSDEERRALAELDELPVAAAVKEIIRGAMLAGFVRARQDSGR
jgi:Dna[CI] antecedent, DciA